MSISRRTMLRGCVTTIGVGMLAPAGCRGRTASAAEKGVAWLHNHVGFTPTASKVVLLRGGAPGTFAVVREGTDTIAFRGELAERGGDFGKHFAADFGALRDEGTFVVRTAGGAASEPFAIGGSVYDAAINHSVAYFAKQRCGDSTSGYHAPCHLDDGRRSDDRKPLDVTGGWHDACDLRKWVTATIYGMTGLAGVLDRMGETGRVNRDAIVDEMRWGNRYFLKMQARDGYVMDYCGGDDGNNWTDNRKGTADDRAVHVEPCELPAQFNFVIAQAAMARQTRESDPAYARQCDVAARRCLQWCTTKRNPGAATSLAAALLALVELRKTTPDGNLITLVETYAARLLSLQVVPSPRERRAIVGHFLRAPDDPRPSREIMHGNLPLLALCAVIEQFPTNANVLTWRDALAMHADHLVAMAGRGAFGTVPFGLYTDKDPGGNRTIGSLWYRWFMQDHDERSDSDWWVGINAHLASNGLGLARAARLLDRPELAVLAQRQLDWIVGLNPFGVSTVTGVGRDQPKLFVTGEFRPATPPISGGVMNGIGGTATDAADLSPGSYNTCEYWTPMVAYTMRLMAELGA